MKTTVEIPDALFQEAKEFAAQNSIPLREVIERGLRIVIHHRQSPAKRFKLKTITIKGEGLVEPLDWKEIRTRIYEGHGG